MKKFFSIAFIFLLLPLSLFAQPALTFHQAVTRQSPITIYPIQPEPGSTINRTQLMIEFPKVAGAVVYDVLLQEVRTEGKKTDTVFVREQTDSSNATLISRLEFGRNYIWQYKAYDAARQLRKRSPYYKFSTGAFPAADPKKFRARVIKNASRGNSGVITFDHAHLAVDRLGKPVWCLPPVAGKIHEAELIRDLRISNAGTVTFLTTKNAFEMSIDGRILWQAPNDGKVSGDTVEHYHHELRRLPNGNYMTLSSKYVKRRLPGDTAQVKLEYGTIIEYDFLGRVAWYWSAHTYLKEEDFFRTAPDGKKQLVQPHINAFDVDEKEEFVYACFRDLNRVIRIDKRTGDVSASYSMQTAKQAQDLLRKPHDMKVLPDGSIVVFNGDSAGDPKMTSNVIVLSQPEEGERPKALWKFDCKFDTLGDGKSARGGGVEALPNGNFLVGMGSLSRTIEVTRSKKIMWDVFTESWNENGQRWIPFGQYRSHYASSLYPCYFTASVSEETWRKSTKSVQLEIVNEGTEADGYNVIYKLRGDSRSSGIKVDTLAPGEKKILELIPVVAPGRGQVLEVTVSSKNNSGFVRTFRVPHK